jgi:hypothetical protein
MAMTQWNCYVQLSDFPGVRKSDKDLEDSALCHCVKRLQKRWAMLYLRSKRRILILARIRIKGQEAVK